MYVCMYVSIHLGQVQAAGLPTTRANTHVAEVFFQLVELSSVAGNFLDKETVSLRGRDCVSIKKQEPSVW